MLPAVMLKVQSSFPVKDTPMSEVWEQAEGGTGRGSGDYRVTSALFLPPGPEKQEVLHVRHYCDGEEMQGPLN